MQTEPEVESKKTEKDNNFIRASLTKMKIKKRLVTSIWLIAVIVSLSGILGIVALSVTSNRYNYALAYYGFAQGDIGKAMVTFAETRSTLRGLIGYDDEAAMAASLAAHEEKKELCQQYLKVVEENLIPEEKEIYNHMITSLEKYWELDARIAELGNTQVEEEYVQAQTMAQEELDPLYDEIYSEMAQLIDVKVHKGDSFQQTIQIVNLVILVIIVLIILWAFWLSNSIGSRVADGIINPINSLAARLKAFAEGDLKSRFPAMNHDDEVSYMERVAAGMAENMAEIIEDARYRLNAMADGDYTCVSRIPERYVGDFEELHLAIRTMNENMNKTLYRIGEASKQVAAGASNLAEGSQNLADGSTEQAGAVQELLASFADISAGVEHTYENMADAYNVSTECAKDADKSWEEMQNMVDAMKQINETSQKIESIIAEIEEIASQTNLLSLNASIEAARAGEAGKGFAVVATQIGKLAEESAQSAVNTRELITGTISEVERGNKAAQITAEMIREVVQSINKLTEEVSELTSVSEHQAEQMKEAEKGVNQISEVIQSNAAIAEETSATSEELSAESISLDEILQQFRLVN